jgi:hypothetical protein
LKTQSFKGLWQHGIYKKFRASVLESRRNIDICANCSEGVKVWGIKLISPFNVQTLTLMS